jgi:hypothetical protein
VFTCARTSSQVRQQPQIDGVVVLGPLQRWVLLSLRLILRHPGPVLARAVQHQRCVLLLRMCCWLLRVVIRPHLQHLQRTVCSGAVRVHRRTKRQHMQWPLHRRVFLCDGVHDADTRGCRVCYRALLPLWQRDRAGCDGRAGPPMPHGPVAGHARGCCPYGLLPLRCRDIRWVAWRTLNRKGRPNSLCGRLMGPSIA